MSQKKRKQTPKPKTDKLSQSIDGLGVDFNTLMQALAQPIDKQKEEKK